MRPILIMLANFVALEWYSPSSFWGAILVSVVGTLAAMAIWAMVSAARRTVVLVGLVYGSAKKIDTKPSARVHLVPPTQLVLTMMLKTKNGGTMSSCDVRFVRPTAWKLAHWFGRWQPTHDVMPSDAIGPIDLKLSGAGLSWIPIEPKPDKGGLKITFNEPVQWVVPRVLHVEVTTSARRPCRCQMSLRTHVNGRAHITRASVVVGPTGV
jgi:hypothetical protein